MGNPPHAPDSRTEDRQTPHPPVSWRSTSEGDSLWFSPEWTALTGQQTADSAGIGWMDCVHPEDRGHILAGWHRARTTRLFSADVRVLAQPGGIYRWYRAQALPAAGEQPGWSGTAVDITDLRSRIEGEGRLRASIYHRVRNTLAVIRSIARRTAENSETVEDYRNHFDGRLAAFARTQSHIMRTGDEGVDLEALLADELLANRIGGRVGYGGPEVRLAPRIAEQMGIALYELTANALQYGALSRPSGTLRIDWTAEATPHRETLRINWQEHVPEGGVVEPDTEGFGIELLTRSLRYELDADVGIDFADTGLHCTIAVPLD